MRKAKVFLVGVVPRLMALVFTLTSCGQIQTDTCATILDLELQDALLERLRPVVEALSPNARISRLQVMLERYEPQFRECNNFYSVLFVAITNPNAHTVFTGSSEQYLIYKSGNVVSGPFVDR